MMRSALRLAHRLRRSLARSNRIDAFADVFFPDHCAVCEREIEPLREAQSSRIRRAFCRDCEAGLPWWRAVDGCPRCGCRVEQVSRASCADCLADGSPLHACHALLRYENELRRWVPAFKQPLNALGPVPIVARTIHHLATRFAERLASDPRLDAIDVVTSLPLHPRRLAARSFNHADALAQPIAEALGVPFDPVLLRRTRNTVPQASLTFEARRANVHGAFASADFGREPLRIAVVDDVLTTGSTLTAAAEALLEAGALEVYGLTLVATLPPRARRPRVAARAPVAAYPRAASFRQGEFCKRDSPAEPID